MYIIRMKVRFLNFNFPFLVQFQSDLSDKFIIITKININII